MVLVETEIVDLDYSLVGQVTASEESPVAYFVKQNVGRRELSDLDQHVGLDGEEQEQGLATLLVVELCF